MANIYWAPGTGSDSNNGLTSGTAVRTLPKALSLVGSGEHVIVPTGTHTLTSNINSTLASTSTNVVVRSEADSSTNLTSIISGAGLYGLFQNISGVNTNLTIRNLKFINTVAVGGPFYFSGGNTQVTFRNLVFSGCEDAAKFTAAGNNTTFTIEDVLVGNGTTVTTISQLCVVAGAITGLNIAINRVTIRSNVNAYERGILSFNSASATGSATIKNCILQNIGSNAGFVTWTAGGTNAVVLQIKNNCYHNSGIGSLGLSSGTFSALTSSGNITSDPKFCDANFGDFRLLPSSPCLDTGTL
jgi:hypothetical protein